MSSEICELIPLITKSRNLQNNQRKIKCTDNYITICVSVSELKGIIQMYLVPFYHGSFMNFQTMQIVRFQFKLVP